jgi:hypothetical protein
MVCTLAIYRRGEKESPITHLNISLDQFLAKKQGWA